jgi:hypothetical protein
MTPAEYLEHYPTLEDFLDQLDANYTVESHALQELLESVQDSQEEGVNPRDALQDLLYTVQELAGWCHTTEEYLQALIEATPEAHPDAGA